MPNQNEQNPYNDAQSSRAGMNEATGQVKVLSPEERDGFKGTTINTGVSGKGDQKSRNYYEYDYRDPYKRVYVRRIKLNSLISVLNILAISLIVLMVIMIFSPFFLYLGIPLLIIAIFNNLFRRY
jgi:hypothetical protein